MSPPNVYIQALALVSQNVTSFGDTAIKEVLKLKSNLTDALTRRGNMDTQRDARGVHAQKKDRVRTQQEDTQREALRRGQTCQHLDVGLLVSRL